MTASPRLFTLLTILWKILEIDNESKTFIRIQLLEQLGHQAL